MEDLLIFYKRTWWAWLLIVITLVLLGTYVNGIIFILVPIILVYSVYFGMVRISDNQHK